MKRHKDDADHARAAVRLTDGVAADLFRRLAVPAPERGGALLAVGGLVHAFVEDTAGVYSAVSWTISTDLSDVVGELEDDGHGVLAGTVHSHPAGVPDPSAVDISTTRLALRQNPHLSSLLIGVITAGAAREHDLALDPHHRLSMHVLAQHSSRPSRVPEPSRV